MTDKPAHPEASREPGRAEATASPPTSVNLTGAVVGGDVIGGNKIVNIFGSRSEARERRDQLVLLDKVNQFWIKGVLEKSVHAEVLIQLGKQFRPEAIEHPWRVVLDTPETGAQGLAPEKKIGEIFAEAGHSLLILGAPGSGKTITLLELARDLIARAEKDAAQPIPVVFNLSTWAERRPPLVDWLADELSLKYQIARKIGRRWLAENSLLPLLDGLDEVHAAHRAACVEAVNAFYSEHSLAGIAVCSRQADYELLKGKLKLGGALLLQPLTDEQVLEYLGSVGGARLHPLYTALRSDAALREMAQSPLMLSVMSIAYADVTLDDLLSGQLTTPDARRAHLFGAYVERMFARVARTKNELYTKNQTLRWLSGLAQGMQQHGQSVFLIEGLQRSWLPRTHRLIYQLGVVLCWTIIPLLCFAAPIVISAPLTSRQMIILALGGLTLATSFTAWLSSTRDIVTIEAIKWSWKATLGLRFLKALLTDRREAWASLWHEQIDLGFIGGSLTGLVASALVGIPVSAILSSDPQHRLALVGYITIAFTLSVGLLYAVLSGLGGTAVLIKTVPNQGIRQSAKNAWRVTLLFGLLGGLGGWAIGAYSRWVALGLGLPLRLGPELIGAVFGAGLGAYAGFYNYGGRALIKHYLLRLTLWHARTLPFNLPHFLAAAADRIFLRKVGGGYIFIHRSLLEYFAEIEPSLKEA